MNYITLVERDGKELIYLKVLENTEKNKTKLTEERNAIMQAVTKDERRRVVYVMETTSNPNETNVNRKTRRINDKNQKKLVAKMLRGFESKKMRELQAKEANTQLKNEIRKNGVFIADGVFD